MSIYSPIRLQVKNKLGSFAAIRSFLVASSLADRFFLSPWNALILLGLEDVNGQSKACCCGSNDPDGVERESAGASTRSEWGEIGDRALCYVL
jgi:hypothetical protein